jgi:outer membrane protein TolC
MRLSTIPFFARRLLVAAALAAIGGCALAPAYEAPAITIPANFKESGDWVQATPADDAPRGAWWTVFNDPMLNELAAEVQVSNQNVAAASAAYAQARALVAGQRAALFPTVSLDGGADRSGGGSARGSSPRRNR